MFPSPVVRLPAAVHSLDGARYVSPVVGLALDLVTKPGAMLTQAMLDQVDAELAKMQRTRPIVLDALKRARAARCYVYPDRLHFVAA